MKGKPALTHPFLILSLPRSRSYWLSRFLSFGGRVCDHEPSRHFRDMPELHAYLSKPDLAAADTAMLMLGRSIATNFPEIRIVTVRRSITEVARSVRALGWGDPKLEVRLFNADALLDEIEAEHPCLSVDFSELDDKAVCDEIFEYCLGRSLPHWWFEEFNGRNLQCDAHAVMAEALQNRAGMAALYGAN